METDKLLQLVLTSVVLLVIVLVAVNSASFYDREVIETITVVDIAFDYTDFPCLYSCYTNLQGDEASLLNNYFSGVRGSDVMINYFPCNYELVSIATILFELSRWNVVKSGGAFEAIQNTGIDVYESAKEKLYYCLKSGLCDNIVPVSFLCELDDYLYSYPFFPCHSYGTLNDFINPYRSVYANRNGTDINNNFLCYGDGPYDLCAPGPDTGYGIDCRPSWVTLKGFYEEGYSYARCDDFAILYYSLFRAVGVPVNDLSVNISYCDLPCPCKKLFNLCSNDLSYNEVQCAYPANLSVDMGVGESTDIKVIEACSLTTIGSNVNWEQGLIQIHSEEEGVNYNWFINQSRFGVNNASYIRTLIFDNDPSNDINITYFGYYNGTDYLSFDNISPGDPCDNYLMTPSDIGNLSPVERKEFINELAVICDFYLSYGEKEIVSDKIKTPFTLTEFVNLPDKCFS